MNIFKWFKEQRDNEYVTKNIKIDAEINGLLLDIHCKASPNFPEGYTDRLTIWDDTRELKGHQKIDQRNGELYYGFGGTLFKTIVPVTNRKVIDIFSSLLNDVQAIVVDSGNLTPVHMICYISIRENLKKKVQLNKTITVKRKDLI